MSSFAQSTRPDGRQARPAHKMHKLMRSAHNIAHLLRTVIVWLNKQKKGTSFHDKDLSFAAAM